MKNIIRVGAVLLGFASGLVLIAFSLATMI